MGALCPDEAIEEPDAPSVHRLAAAVLQAGPMVQELFGHRDVVSTTMIYTHVLNRGGHGVRSPLDTLGTESVI